MASPFDETIRPNQFSLSQNYPNPFNSATTIKYHLEKSGEIEVSIYNVKGQKLEILVNEIQAAGTYQTTWDASKYPTGLYFYKLKFGHSIETIKMLNIK